ncbi:DUF6510 family protein [Georgenia sp. SUBG003]|uniref:DUF6510 family protein n=1 Tax=Georgenia sp. SUBG003 TaxID=1497974 RepID=UPI0004D6CDD3|nr:hypothetical protein DA06_19495 [Georgenia sp. SUBG003]
MTADDETTSRRLDGNAAAGPLRDLFTVDLAAATVVCAGCARTAALATYTAYADAPALVLRCPDCSGVVLRFSSADGTVRLDLTGTRLLVARPPDGQVPGSRT